MPCHADLLGLWYSCLLATLVFLIHSQHIFHCSVLSFTRKHLFCVSLFHCLLYWPVVPWAHSVMLSVSQQLSDYRHLETSLKISGMFADTSQHSYPDKIVTYLQICNYFNKSRSLSCWLARLDSLYAVSVLLCRVFSTGTENPKYLFPTELVKRNRSQTKETKALSNQLVRVKEVDFVLCSIKGSRRGSKSKHSRIFVGTCDY